MLCHAFALQRREPPPCLAPKFPLPGIAKLLPPASILALLARTLQNDHSGALARLSAYQRGLLVDFIRIFEFYTQQEASEDEFQRFIGRLASTATAATGMLADHTGMLHGHSQWARVLYPVSTLLPNLAALRI